MASRPESEWTGTPRNKYPLKLPRANLAANLKYGLEFIAEDAEEMGQAGREEAKETGVEEVKKAFAAWLKKVFE